MEGPCRELSLSFNSLLDMSALLLGRIVSSGFSVRVIVGFILDVDLSPVAFVPLDVIVPEGPETTIDLA